jgi:hypothetical protein
VKLRALLTVLLASATLPLWGACGGGGGSAGPNLFRNPGFEDGQKPWTSLTTEAWGTPFSVSEDAAHSGTHSAFLHMQATEDAGSKVFGVVQDIQPKEFPELLSGYYRVAQWKRGTPIQYMQFVVIAFASTNVPQGFPNHQIRYLLAGTSEPPFDIANAKFIYVGTEEPRPDGWVYFERNIRQDFIDQWGAAPVGFSSLRILFEVRYDSKAEGVTTPAADVYYDDLYLGPAADNPNTP